MKCWVGKEIEYNQNFGNITLFVKSSKVDIRILLKILEEHQEVKSIYFGAGSIDVYDILGDYNDFSWLKLHYNLIVESSLENATSLIHRYGQWFDNIIISIPTSTDELASYGNLSFKTKYDNIIYVINNLEAKSTNLDTLSKEGLFTDVDEIVYYEE